MAADLAGIGAVVLVNTQENPRLAERFGIRSIPTLAMLRKGEVIASVNGAMDRHALLAWWKRHVD